MAAQYEYAQRVVGPKSESGNLDMMTFGNVLNDLAAQGWRVIDIQYRSTNYLVTFERPVTRKVSTEHQVTSHQTYSDFADDYLEMIGHRWVLTHLTVMRMPLGQGISVPTYTCIWERKST